MPHYNDNSNRRQDEWRQDDHRRDDHRRDDDRRRDNPIRYSDHPGNRRPEDRFEQDFGNNRDPRYSHENRNDRDRGNQQRQRPGDVNHGGSSRGNNFDQRETGHTDRRRAEENRGFGLQERRDAGSPYSGSPRGQRKENGPTSKPSGGPPGQSDFGWSPDGMYGRNPTMGGQPYYRNQGMNFNEDLTDRHQNGDRNYDRDFGRSGSQNRHPREDRS